MTSKMKQHAQLAPTLINLNEHNESSDQSIKKERLIEALERLDLAQFKSAISVAATDVSTPFSYDDLYRIARSIIALNIGKTFATIEDRDKYEESLTKLLQVCQTIIDFLLVDGKRFSSKENNDDSDEQKQQQPAQQHSQPSSNKNDINEYHNNLLQENIKLRKLLTLQQKAIAFRRANLEGSNNTSILYASNSAGSGGDDDVTTSLEEADNLSENDSSQYKSNSSSVGFRYAQLALQCIYCPKIFADHNSFAKHLLLRHLSSSIDGSFSSSSSSSSSLLNRLQHLHKKTINADSTSNDTISTSTFDNQKIINQLMNEIVMLKQKLQDTEKVLNEEKSARRTFEDHLKNGLEENVQRLQKSLIEKIEEVKFLRNETLIATSQAANANRTCAQLLQRYGNNQQLVDTASEDITRVVVKDAQHKSAKSSNNKTKATKTVKHKSDSKLLSEPQQSNVKEKFDFKVEDKSSKLSKLKSDETQTQTNKNASQSVVVDQQFGDKDSSNKSPTELKESLRLQLLSQLTEKQQPQHKSKSKSTPSHSESQQQKSKIAEVEPRPMAHMENSDKEQTKAEIHSSIEHRLSEYLQQASSRADIDRNDNANSSSNQSNGISKLDENQYTQAMRQVQRDRDLLIHQSRYDYDFKQIEANLKEIVDNKLRSKLQSSNQTSTQSNDKVDGGEKISQQFESINGHTFIVETIPQDEFEPSAPSPPEEDGITTDSKLLESSSTEPQDKVESPSTTSSSVRSNSSKETKLKSILKRRHNRNVTDRFGIDDSDSKDNNNVGRSTQRKNSPQSRRISFNGQIIEYAISPRQSSDEEDESDNDQQLLESESNQASRSSVGKKNQMFIIRSLNDQSDFDDRGAYDDDDASSSDNFVGEKIYINEYSSTSSSSDEDDIREPIESVTLKNTANSSSSSSSSSNVHMVSVDVHHQPNDENEENQVDSIINLTPVPAKRKSVPTTSNTSMAHNLTTRESTSRINTLQSLLLDDPVQSQEDNWQESSNKPLSTTTSPSSTRVHELAELIERKLQQSNVSAAIASSSSSVLDHQSNDMKNNSSAISTTLTNSRRLPIGSVDTLAHLRQSTDTLSSSSSISNNPKSTTTTKANVSENEMDIYDF